MTKLLAAACLAVIVASVANVVALAFGLWRLDEIAVRAEDRVDAAADGVVHELRTLRLEVMKATRVLR